MKKRFISARNIAHVLQAHYVVTFVLVLTDGLGALGIDEYVALAVMAPTFLVPMDSSTGEATYAGLRRVLRTVEEMVDAFCDWYQEFTGAKLVRTASDIADSAGSNDRIHYSP